VAALRAEIEALKAAKARPAPKAKA
jgi:hypothetical protein